jgi:hypothetical protein
MPNGIYFCFPVRRIANRFPTCVTSPLDVFLNANGINPPAAPDEYPERLALGDRIRCVFADSETLAEPGDTFQAFVTHHSLQEKRLRDQPAQLARPT